MLVWLPLLLSLATTAASDWLHGWDTTAAMTFADFNSDVLLTDAQLSFVSSKYRVVSLEKCTGVRSNLTTETAIYATARRLKQRDPTTKVFFYLATDQQGIQCYAADKEFQAHPDWWLKDDTGAVVDGGGHPVMDCTNPAARAWWRGIPLRGEGDGRFEGAMVAGLIDGVLADGSSFAAYPNISAARAERLQDAKFQMLKELQQELTVANDGIVMANGIDMYPLPHADPRDPDNHNLAVLSFANGIMNEHTAVFESVNPHNASFNMETVSQNLDAIEAAAHMANGSKLVFVQTWPGLYASTDFYPTQKGPARVYPPSGEPTPQTTSQWRDALRSHFAFAHAIFLSVAEQNTYWFYGGVWYPSTSGIIGCPDGSCPAPPEWYPDLKRPLGRPLGPRVNVGPYRWRRHFQHCTVFLDLFHPNASGVQFHTH